MAVPGKASLANLAPDVLLSIFSWVRPCDAIVTASAARALRKMIADDQLWHVWSSLLDPYGRSLHGSGGKAAFRRRALGQRRWQKLEIEGSAPPWRQNCSAAAVGSKALVLQGGRGPDDTLLKDAWRLDIGAPGQPSSWQVLPSETCGVGPGARSHQDVAVFENRYFVVHGGSKPSGYRDNDTFVLDLQAEPPAWEDITRAGSNDLQRPTARFHHTFTALGNGHSAIVFGGHDRTISAINDVALLEKSPSGHWGWRLATAADQNRARLEEGRPPPFATADVCGRPRAFHTAVAMGTTSMAIFGGVDAESRPLDDLRLLDYSQSVGWEVLPDGPRPPARSRHGAAVAGTQLLVFGGAPGITPWDRDPLDLWSIDLADALKGGRQGCWTRLAFNLLNIGVLGWPRHWLVPSLFITEGYAVAFGGHRSTQHFDHFGDATQAERMEAAGDAAGSLAVLPWHRLWTSRMWRVLSALPDDTAWKSIATPAAIVTSTALPLLLGFQPRRSEVRGRDIKSPLGVYELQLCEEEDRIADSSALQDAVD